jgi:hypothetical protein
MNTLARLIRAALIGAGFLLVVAAAAPPLEPPPPSLAAYRAWLAEAPGRAAEVGAFERYLARQGVAGIFPTYQVLRTESSWVHCGGRPFTLAPRTVWPHIVRTLSFIRAFVAPNTGPLEVVSGYRDPRLNVCAGGAAQSAHVGFWALDLVPTGPITRDVMIARLCAVHAAHGRTANIGLGFYAGTRFHVDSWAFRRWGADRHSASSPCLGVAG